MKRREQKVNGGEEISALPGQPQEHTTPLATGQAGK